MTVTETEKPKTNLDVEQEFLFHLADQDSLEYILREGVTNDLIISARISSVFQFVQHHWNRTGKIPTLGVLKVEFPVIDFEKPESTIQWVVDKLRERYQQTQVTNLTIDLAKKVEKPTEAMDFLRDRVFEIERNSMSTSQVSKAGDHKLFLRELQQKVVSGHFKGVSIGFPEIDKFTGGVKVGNVAYILARPKRKKTWIVLSAFIQQVRDGEIPYLGTLENTKQEIELRISCLLSGFPWDKAQRGELMSADYKLLERSWEEFSSGREFYIEQPPMDERTVPQLMAKADKFGATSIIISQFHYIQGLRDWYQADHLMRAEVAVDLKRAATRPGTERPIIVEAQFNRGGDSMEELQDFQASKVGLTDMIPQSADILYGLFESKDLRANNTTEFGILESRNTDKGAWYVESAFRQRTELRLVTNSLHQ